MAQSDDLCHVAMGGGGEESNLLAEDVAQVPPSLHQLLNGIQLCPHHCGREEVVCSSLCIAICSSPQGLHEHVFSSLWLSSSCGLPLLALTVVGSTLSGKAQEDSDCTVVIAIVN